MSATMARQVGRVQLEQSEMRLALNMAKMATEGFSRAAIEETKYLIKTPRAKVREAKKWGVEFPGYKKVKAAIQGHWAMLRQNQTSGSTPYHKCTAKNAQTRSRCKGTAALPPARLRVRTPQPTPPSPGKPPALTSTNSRAPPSEIVHLPGGHAYSYKGLPCAGFFEDDQDTEHDTDFDADMLTDDG